MELDSIWDEGFFSMVSDELNYEFDENDLFKDPEDALRGTIKHENSEELSNFIQSDLDSNSKFCDKTISIQAEREKNNPVNFENLSLENKFALNNIATDISFYNRQDSVNSTPSSLGLYHEFTGRGNVKNEINARGSINSDIFNSDGQIIIDAKIFLDSYNAKKEYIETKPSRLIVDDESKLNSSKKISSTSCNQSQKLIDYENYSLRNAKSRVAHNVIRETPDNNVDCYSSKKHLFSNIENSHKPDNKVTKSKDFIILHDDKKYQINKTKTILKDDKNRKYLPYLKNKNYQLKDAKSNLNTNNKKRECDEKKIEVRRIRTIIKTENREKHLNFLPLFTHPDILNSSKKYKSENTNDTSIGIKHKSSQGKINLKPDIQHEKHVTSVYFNVDKKCDKMSVNANSEIEKSKKAGSSLSTSDGKHKSLNAKINVKPDTEQKKRVSSAYSSFVTDKKHIIEKTRVKVEPNILLSHSENKKKLDSVEFEQNFKSNIDNRKYVTRQSSLTSGKKTILSEYNCKVGFPPGRKNMLSVKREQIISYDHANSEIEPSSNDHLFEPKLILEKLQDKVAHDSPVFKPKDEILDQKPVLRLNVLHLPRAKVVLKRLTEADLRSPASLLARVKTEMYENISRKLRSQGKARNKDFIHLYCCNCKNLQIARKGLSRIKSCENCSFQMIYLCVKCNEKQYVNYDHLHRHFKICRGSGETKRDGLESIILHRCTECTFKTTYPKIMASHVKRNGHKADGEFDIDKALNSAKRESKNSKCKIPDIKCEVPEKHKIPRTKYAKLIINQNKTPVAEVTERYCTVCHKPCSSKTRKVKESCRKCNASLYLRCLKCYLKFSYYNAMLTHLRSKCCPNSFKCAKCDYTNSTWSLMQQHAMEQHDISSKSSRKVNSKKKSKQIFYCKVCRFETNYEHNVKRHMKTVHSSSRKN